MRVVDYAIASSKDSWELRKEIQKYLSEGWELYGSPFRFDYETIAQALILIQECEPG